MAKKTLLDEVLTRAVATKRGTRSWFQLLPDDAQRELETVRQAFDPGVHEKSTYARAIMAVAQERGWKTSGLQGVIKWLNEKR